MKTTTSPPPKGDSVVLITGGSGGNKNWNASTHSIEIYVPNTPGEPCILHDLPEGYYGHTQDGGMICGGVQTQNTCRRWNPKEGIFPYKTVHGFEPGRYAHVSWTPVYEKETFLIGGGSNLESRNSSTLVKQGTFAGSDGFPKGLKYALFGACSIPDPDTDTVVITGGRYSEKTSSVYNEYGFIEYLGDLNFKRYEHGCTSYVSDNTRVYIFNHLYSVKYSKRAK